MRSDKSTIDQLLMCMSKPQPGEDHPTHYLGKVKIEPSPMFSSDNSRTSTDDNDTIAFGPIKVKPRKRPAPTLATGRRSKYEILTPDEEQKRNLRRARNRAAAERVRISRLAVEQQLQNQIDELERQTEQLANNVENLRNRKLQLETRIFTHQQMCSTSNVPVNVEEEFFFNQPGTSLEFCDEMLDINVEDLIFSHSTTDEQNCDAPLAFTDDFEQLFMDS